MKENYLAICPDDQKLITLSSQKKAKFDKYRSLPMDDLPLDMKFSGRGHISHFSCSFPKDSGHYISDTETVKKVTLDGDTFITTEDSIYPGENITRGGRKHINRKKCTKLECPRCYSHAAFRAAKRSANRIWGIYYSSNSFDHLNLYHISINPAPKDWDLIFDDPKKAQDALLQRYYYKLGIFDAIWICFHPIRVWRGQNMYWAPHFHCIVMTELDTQGLHNWCESNYKENDIVIKVHHKKIEGTKEYEEFGNIQAYQDLRAIIFYNLTHCGFYAGRNAYNKYGEFANSKWKVKVLETEEKSVLDPDTNGFYYEIEEFDIVPGGVNHPALKLVKWLEGQLENVVNNVSGGHALFGKLNEADILARIAEVKEFSFLVEDIIPTKIDHESILTVEEPIKWLATPARKRSKVQPDIDELFSNPVSPGLLDQFA